eukprot:4899327-Pyramimonas_sp.AAC.1
MPFRRPPRGSECLRRFWKVFVGQELLGCSWGTRGMPFQEPFGGLLGASGGPQFFCRVQLPACA